MRDEPDWVYYEICEICGEWFDPFIAGNKSICLNCQERKEEMKDLVTVDKNMSVSGLSPQDVLKQVAQIQELMKIAMKKDEHYGVIPGTQKPTLLKAGAEKLGFMFRLSPQFEIERVENLSEGHKEYIVKCKLVHIPTGKVWGEGVGSCSTMESKYRWRKRKVDTGEPIPSDYKQNKSNYKAQGYVAGKDENGKWRWYKQEKVENEDIADVYNTVLKMAKKRAHVDAMLTATAASDIFTQDVEEIMENMKMYDEDVEDAEVVEEPPKKEKPKESAEVKDRKMEIITKIRDAIMEHTGNNFAEAHKELERFTQFVGDDGQVIPGVKSTELMKGWTFKRIQVTWGKIKKEYGIE